MAAQTIWFNYEARGYHCKLVSEIAAAVAAYAAISGNGDPLSVGMPLFCSEDAGLYHWNGESFDKFGA